MAFFSQLKQDLRNQMSSQPAPQPIMRFPNKGITSLPQEDLNLDFLRSLPKNMMPNLDFSNIPQLPQNFKFNPQLGSIVPGYAWGGLASLLKSGKGLIDKIKNKKRYYERTTRGGRHLVRPGWYTPKEIEHMQKIVFGNPMTRTNTSSIPYQGMIGTKAGLESGKFTLGTTPRGGGQLYANLASNRLGTPLTDSLRRGTENLITAGALTGGVALTDATEGFTEAPSRENLDLSNYLRNLQFPPEELGKSLAGLGFKLDQAMSMVAQRAQEIGAPVVDYVNKAKLAYAQEMEDQRMRQIDKQQGLRHVIPSFGFIGPGGAEPIADLSPEIREILYSEPGEVSPPDKDISQEIPQIPQIPQSQVDWLNNISQ